MVDSERVAKSTAYQGIAFWVNGRLVGSTGWVVGSEAVVDGRSRFAKRYSIVVKADDAWLSEIEPDWSKFKTNQKTKALFAAVRDYAQGVNASLSASLAEESSEDALLRHREEFKELTRLEQAKVATFARVLVGAIPTASQEFLSSAVQALINLERARGGAALLDRLTKLDDADIDGLDRLLGEWSVQDALSVLDEIDHRLAVVAAIEKLSADEGADELHTLHPLVTQARWLFGPEFDSSEFASNMTLRSAAETVFSKRLVASEFQNARRRPDIVVLSDATCSIVGSEEFDSANPALARMRNVLIIELKRGRSAIGRDEMTQADGYVQDFLGLGAIDGEPTISAFVVGHDIAPKTTRDKELRDGARRGRVQATTYGQLVRTANQRLFRLKDRIPARYEDVSGADLSARIMQTASQAPLL